MIIFILFFIYIIFSKCDYETFEDRRVDEDDQKLFHGYLVKKMKETIPNIIEKWKSFKKQYKLKYAGHENKFRFFTYAKAAIFIYEFMKDNSSTFEVGENHLSHLSREEYFVMLGSIETETEDKWDGLKRIPEVENTREYPNTKDWRDNNVVTQIKDQDYCGSCYSFAALAAVESAIAIKTGNLYDLSEQEIVDCTEDNFRCQGGFVPTVFKYMMDRSVADESTYPYTGDWQKCKNVPGFAPKLRNFYTIPEEDEETLAKTLLIMGPVTVDIDARFDSFKLYKKGVYQEPRCTKTDVSHSMLLVGVTDTYYIVKNSYGIDFGMNGYIHIARNAGNMCGIACRAFLPLL